MKILIFFLSIISFLSSYSQNYKGPQNYKGTLGKHPIYFKIEHYSDEYIEASYFYNSHLKNIKLKGELTVDGYNFYLKYSKPEEKKELFILKKTSNKLIGKWINGKVSLPVNLIKINFDFKSYKKKRLRLEKLNVQKFDNLEIEWFKEKYSEIELFRLRNGFSKSQREYLNKKLDSIQRYFALENLECAGYNVSFHIKLLTSEIVSFTENYNVYCGGAYPAHGVSHYNFDLVKNKEIENLNDLYPKLNFVQFLKKKYQNSGLDGFGPNKCEFFEPHRKDIWEYSEFYLTKTSIMIQPSYPHMMAPCREYFEILKLEIEK